MPREKLLFRIPGARRCFCYEELLVLVDKDYAAACVLSCLEYLSNGESQRLENRGEKGEPWVTISRSKLSFLIMGMFSERTVLDATKKLEDLKFIQSKQDGKRNSYLLNTSLLNGLLDPRNFAFNEKEELYLRRIALVDGPDQRNSALPPTQNCVGGDCYKEEVLKVLKEEVLEEPPLPEIKNQETPEPQLDLQLDEEPMAFVKNAYRQSRPAKLPNASELKRFRIEERVTELECGYGPEEFRTALWAYLGESTDWARQNKWPLAAFLKKMESCGAFTIPKSPTPRIENVRFDPVYRAPVQAELPGTEPPVCPKLDMDQIAARYKELAPHAPPLIMSRGSRPDFPALHDPDFFARMDDIFRKMESLWLIGTKDEIGWLNLPWVMKSRDGLLNWNALMMGSLDGMCGRKSAPSSGNRPMTKQESQRVADSAIALLRKGKK